MSYVTFKNKWLGSRVDYDGVYGYQCVDLIKQYAKEEYGLSPGAWGNAIDYWTRTNGTLLTKFSKVSGNSAMQGDIVIMHGLAGNPYGHIGIATGRSNGSSVEILEQNGSTGNGSGTGGDAIRTRYVSRSRVAGLLRPKTSNNQGGNNMPTLTTREDLDFLYISNIGRPRTPGEGEDVYLNKDYRFVDRDTYNSKEANTRRTQKAAELNSLHTQVQALSGQVSNLTGQVADLKKVVKAKDTEINRLKAEVAAGGNNEDSVQLNALGAALKWFIQRLGLK